MTASASSFAALASARSRTEATSIALVPHNPLRFDFLDLDRTSRSYCHSSALKNLTNDIPEVIKHTYHCYSRDEPHQIYNSTDIRLLVREIQRSYELLSRLNEMRRGALGSALVSIENELTLDAGHYPQSKFLPRPPNHEQPLRFPQHLIDQSATLYTRPSRSLVPTKPTPTGPPMPTVGHPLVMSLFNLSNDLSLLEARPTHSLPNVCSMARSPWSTRQEAHPVSNPSAQCIRRSRRLRSHSR